ncbi:MAG: UDP-glucose 4-epimerase GalE [Bacteroidetes bacterium GWF2_42_66]|nr:MAG: UDP-glucose 4-epimerase GalE [Bacteroidetes bacterium GWA2_42_15]OFX96917.1 MAG: UDP-glucose 4-epimerase GalE [Bacteroidetes bacterium GWE2_42_39]OFY44674.1 MAG: UDP-glucose 4-epimerase GalE [Bacteroidetes bacterium GWF2_42_66]HBL75038.1 UDP-glucose 4-epimerase GalE [Prolixibacteraceae bacterium]HCR91572.1 UDP-glucose 4-epimerase GalE [Prolixibacteraceae bacterium]
MTQILVTGGTGYIGSHTVVELQNAGYEVVIVDDLSNSNIDVLDNITKITGKKLAFEQFNLADAAKTDEFFSRNKNIAAIIHFAASKAVGESVQIPLHYYRNNLVSLMNLLDCQLKYGVANIVFSSSCTVYGQPDKLPVTESTPRKDAESPYGNTKRVNEDILHDTIHANPQLKGIALRYFNPIGAHPSALIGELPLGVPQNLVPFITQTAAGLRKELSIFGNDYDTVDGSAVRDYINVVDLAKAHVIAIERLLKGKNKAGYEVFNLGTGNGSSVLEIVNAFEKVTGVKLNYIIVPRRAGDIEKIWADTTYANNELGWKAEKGLEETLLSAWNWEKRVRRIQ